MSHFRWRVRKLDLIRLSWDQLVASADRRWRDHTYAISSQYASLDTENGTRTVISDYERHLQKLIFGIITVMFLTILFYYYFYKTVFLDNYVWIFNDEYGFQNEYLIFYWVLDHSFQNNISARLYSGISVDCHEVLRGGFLNYLWWQ